MKRSRIAAVLTISILLLITYVTYDSDTIRSGSQVESEKPTSVVQHSDHLPEIAEFAGSENEVIVTGEQKVVEADDLEQPGTNEVGNDSRPQREDSNTPSFASTSGKKMSVRQELVDIDLLAGNDRVIMLRAGGIDTTKGPVTIPEDLRFDPLTINPGDKVRYLVQFEGPVLPWWKNEIHEMGGEFGDYLPNNAFVVSLTSSQKERVTRLPYIYWIDYYHPAYKLSDGFKNKAIVAGARRTVARGQKAKASGVGTVANPQSAIGQKGDEVVSSLATEIETVLVMVQAYSQGRLPYLYALANSQDGTFVVEKSDTAKSRVIVEVPLDSLEQILPTFAQAGEVEWVEPFVPPSLDNKSMNWLVQSNVPEAATLWNKGLTGAGQVVGIGDTGLDADMVFFWDETQGLPSSVLNHNQRKVIAYHDLAGNGDWDTHDHGTHVAGTIAGNSTGVNSDYNGVAYDAKLVIQDIGDGGSLTGIPGDLNTYFLQAYNDGARIHSNSWGSAVGGAYTSYSRDADEFMWNHKDFLIVFSAGNSGSEVNTVGSPGTAKNVLTSGASENGHAGYDQDNVAYFSSNGPTDDGRTKPTITAPGHYLKSADSDGLVTTFNSGLRTMSGTSMSAPSHAGSAALVRQYFVDGYYPTGTDRSGDELIPSGALIKASMVNSSVSMEGEFTDGPVPSTGQGWGRIMLENTLYFQGDDHKLFVDDNDAGLNTGEEQTYAFYSDGTGQVRITLVWTDYYPSLSGAIQLVNDLDLVVSGPTSTYVGNVFSSGFSVIGGTADRLNVVENVYLEVPEKGAYTITVKGHNIPVGPQPYALVVTGLSSGSATGTVSFNSDYYRPDGVAVVSLNDLDLNISAGIDTAMVVVSSDSSEEKELILTELTPESGTFAGSFVIDEMLNVAEGSTLLVFYEDKSDSSGDSVLVSDDVLIDGLNPSIFATSIDHIDQNSAQVSWSTSETTTGLLLFRKEGDTLWSELDSGLEGVKHTLTLENLEIGTLYEVLVTAKDKAGNETIANDGGAYTFSTDIELVQMHDTVEQGISFFQLTGGADGAGGSGLWHISNHRSFSGTTAWYYGVETTKTYDTGAANWGHITTTNGIDLTAMVKPHLKFNHILYTEDYEPYDLATVEISVDALNYEIVYQATASSSEWEEVSIDLQEYTNKVVHIRFSFNTLDELLNDYEGWIVDDIKIVTYQKKKGDIDGDGKLTLADLLLSLQLMSGMDVAGPIVVGGDVNGDGRIGLAESIQLLGELGGQP